MIKFKEQPIGIFDSGIGGTSIWKEIVSLLPLENTIYLSDSKNAPYGGKSEEEIINLSIKNTEFLVQKKCKLIVVACNTATTNAIDILRKNYDIPFIGIEPAIKPAALKTITNTIGILATKGTLNSKLFEQTSSKIDKRIETIEIVGEGLVSLIEKGNLESKEMVNLLSKYLKPLIENQVDCLVLGCTHYPYLIPQIKKIIGNEIQIIDSGEAVARQTKAILEKNNLLLNSNPKKSNTFFSNSNIKVLKRILKNYKEVNISKIEF